LRPFANDFALFAFKMVQQKKKIETPLNEVAQRGTEVIAKSRKNIWPYTVNGQRSSVTD
jgi:hypothetical protein